jgi:hypothetical protein
VELIRNAPINQQTYQKDTTQRLYIKPKDNGNKKSKRAKAGTTAIPYYP